MKNIIMYTEKNYINPLEHVLTYIFPFILKKDDRESFLLSLTFPLMADLTDPVIILKPLIEGIHRNEKNEIITVPEISISVVIKTRESEEFSEYSKFAYDKSLFDFTVEPREHVEIQRQYENFVGLFFRKFLLSLHKIGFENFKSIELHITIFKSSKQKIPFTKT